MFYVWWQNLLVLSICMTVLWLVSLPKKDASIVDSFWGMAFVVSTATYSVLRGDGAWVLRRMLVVLLVLIWGIRLSLHIYRRNHGQSEDFRYRAFRHAAGSSFWWKSLIKVFYLQGLLAALVGLPILFVFVADQSQAWLVSDVIGALLWIVGFVFEFLGDHQLKVFKANPANKGKVMDKGLWGRTRHPNYFGDAVMWWGIGVIAVGTGGWWSAVGPIIMTIMLMRVSGDALLEKTMVETKPGYKEYMARVPAFFPRVW